MLQIDLKKKKRKKLNKNDLDSQLLYKLLFVVSWMWIKFARYGPKKKREKRKKKKKKDSQLDITMIYMSAQVLI